MAFTSTGDIIGEYINAGHIYSVNFFDIDDDNKDEILFGGTNNTFNNAFLGVLELDYFSGHSPHQDSNNIPMGIAKGKEKYYLKFPFPKELKYAKRNEVNRIRLLPNKNLMLSVIYGVGLDANYVLNKNFDVIDVEFTDGSKYNYKTRFGRDLYQDLPKDLLTNVLTKLEFWDGEKFVSEAVMSNQN